MTLNAALKYEKGTILATDTRVMMGAMKRDGESKIELLTTRIGVAASGLTGATNDILASIKECLKEALEETSFDFVVNTLSDECLKWYKANFEKLEEEDKGTLYSFTVASSGRIRRIFSKGYLEEVKSYDCDGAGKPYGEYILQNHYQDNLTEDKAKELAAYTILETSKVDPSVGDQIQLVVFRKYSNPITVSQEDTENIKLRLAPLSRAFVEEQISKVQGIVEHRDNINDSVDLI